MTEHKTWCYDNWLFIQRIVDCYCILWFGYFVKSNLDCDKVSVVYIWARCVAPVYTSKIVYNLVHSWCKHWFKNMMISVDKLIRNWLTFIYSIGRHKGDTKPEEGFVLLFNVFL